MLDGRRDVRRVLGLVCWPRRWRAAFTGVETEVVIEGGGSQPVAPGLGTIRALGPDSGTHGQAESRSVLTGRRCKEARQAIFWLDGLWRREHQTI
jgi:hypothetical protein